MIAQHLERRGATRCPPAAVAETSADFKTDGRRLRRYEDGVSVLYSAAVKSRQRKMLLRRASTKRVSR